MIRLTDSALSYDVRPYLKDIKTPILIVGAEEDQLTPLVHQDIWRMLYLMHHL